MFGITHSSSRRRNPPIIGGRQARALKSVASSIERCDPVRLPPQFKRGYNRYEGSTVTYRGQVYDVVGCGVGKRQSASAGKLEEGVYALRNRATGDTLFVPKRRMRDLKHKTPAHVENLRTAAAAVKKAKEAMVSAEAAIAKASAKAAKGVETSAKTASAALSLVDQFKAASPKKGGKKAKKAKKGGKKIVANPMSQSAVARRMRELFGR